MDDRQEQLLEQLYRDMYDSLRHYAFTVLQDASRAEEAVQETFRIACGKPAELLESENPNGWLVIAMKGVLRNFLRLDDRASKVFVQLSEPETLQVADEAVHVSPELLYQDLAQTKEYALLQAISEGSTIRELSSQMGLSESACKKRIQRSRQILKKKMNTF